VKSGPKTSIADGGLLQLVDQLASTSPSPAGYEDTPSIRLWRGPSRMQPSLGVPGVVGKVSEPVSRGCLCKMALPGRPQDGGRGYLKLVVTVAVPDRI
jgi:hypothetical protein